jgi:diacylglycerol kinase
MYSQTFNSQVKEIYIYITLSIVLKLSNKTLLYMIKVMNCIGRVEITNTSVGLDTLNKMSESLLCNCFSMLNE